MYFPSKKFPFKESDKADTQLSIYAATKKATESMAHSYANIWKIPITVLRFFTVYGPWGRPDMALFSFTKNIINGQEIKLYNFLTVGYMDQKNVCWMDEEGADHWLNGACSYYF